MECSLRGAISLSRLSGAFSLPFRGFGGGDDVSCTTWLGWLGVGVGSGSGTGDGWAAVVGWPLLTGAARRARFGEAEALASTHSSSWSSLPRSKWTWLLPALSLLMLGLELDRVN